jgi:hypothetical protein
VDLAVEKLGGEEAAAKRLGVSRAAIHRWATKDLSVEAAVLLAEVLMLPLEAAVPHASRRLVLPKVSRSASRAAAPAGAARP